MKALYSLGFTLIEIIIFIVVFSLGVMGVMTIFYNTLGKTSDPTLRLQGVQTAQAVLEEIYLKKFDENTPNGGGKITVYSTFGIDTGENSITKYDDVDDFVNTCGSEKNFSSADFGLKNGYNVAVKVSYAQISPSKSITETCTSTTDYKFITVTVTNPNVNEKYNLKVLKGNF